MLPDGLAATDEKRHEAHAVFACRIGQVHADGVGERRHEIGLMDELVADAARLHHAGPAHDEGHAVPPFPGIPLVATERAAGKVTTGLQVLGADVWGEAIITGENDERVVGGAGLVECGEDVADNGVGFHDQIGTGVLEATFPLPPVAHGQRRVGGRER